MKLHHVVRRKKNSRHGERFYTAVDMACIKLDESIENSRIKRGEITRKGNGYISVCGCGVEGCFLHGSFDKPVQAAA